MNGDRWRLPDGREAVELARTERTLRVLPLAPASGVAAACAFPESPWPGAPEWVWRAACVKRPSRYLHGAIPAEEAD